MRKARPLTDTAICVFKLFVGTRCEIDSNTRVVISSQNRFHGSTHISLVPNKVEFSQRVSIPGLGGDSHPFRFGLKDTVFIVKPFLKFNTCLIRLDSRNSHRQPHTQGIGKLNPRRISAVQQNIETGESIRFRICFHITGKSDNGRIKFVKKLIINFLLRIRTVMLPCICKILVDNRSVIIRHTVHRFHFQNFRNTE